MPTGYVLLFAAVVAALSGWLGYGHGRSHERGIQALAMQSAIITTFEAARADATAEAKRRQAAALRHARLAAGAAAAKLKGQIHALETARAGCDWPDARVRMLNAAVRAAAGDDQPATDGVLDLVPNDTAAADGKRSGGGDVGL